MSRGQVWIETVLYTLIGLALIGIVLAITMPKINESRDRILVEQTIDSLNAFELTINEVIDRGPGNVRTIPEYRMKRGELFINSTRDSIVAVLNDLHSPYSEPGIPIKIGNVVVLSEEGQKKADKPCHVPYILEGENK